MKNNTKLAAAFTALMLASPAAIAQESATTTPQIDVQTTATYIFNTASRGFEISFGQPFPNMQACLTAMQSEASDFNEMRDSDIIASGDSFTIKCEDADRIVESRFTREFGEQRQTHFKR